MRNPKAGHPEFFIEAHSVDHQRVALPVADRMSQETRIELVGWRMGTAIRVHDAPYVRSSSRQDQYAFGFGDFINQQTIRRMKLSRAARRETPRMRIALALFDTPYLVQSPRPWHERNVVDIKIG